MIIRLACVLLFTAIAASGAEAWRIEMIETPGPVRELNDSAGEPRIATPDGWYRVIRTEAGLRFEKAEPPRLPPIPRDALPDARIAVGAKEIARSWFAEPTRKYGHGVLGDAIEADSLVVEDRGGKIHAVRAGGDAVFEDIEPRIAEFGGGEKIVAVKSYLAAGAALAVIGPRAGRYEILAETPPIGTPNRWLNPAGIADFDGDGAVEIALVRMPHALGRLELWRWNRDKLSKAAETRDSSNHAIGSRSLKSSAVADFDGDGIADLAIPSFDRRAVRLLSFPRGVRELARFPLSAAVTTDFVRFDAREAGFIFALADGTLVRLRP